MFADLEKISGGRASALFALIIGRRRTTSRGRRGLSLDWQGDGSLASRGAIQSDAITRRTFVILRAGSGLLRLARFCSVAQYSDERFRSRGADRQVLGQGLAIVQLVSPSAQIAMALLDRSPLVVHLGRFAMAGEPLQHLFETPCLQRIIKWFANLEIAQNRQRTFGNTWRKRARFGNVWQKCLEGNGSPLGSRGRG
jgi:hypothetical protein